MPPPEKKVFKSLMYSVLGGLLVASMIFVILLVRAEDSEHFLTTNATQRSFLHLADTATLVTERGSITIKFEKDLAPNAVANFIKLADRGFYDDTIFHRVISGGVIQGGDPTGEGDGGPGYSLIPEVSEKNIKRGLVVMARDGKRLSGSQFIIVSAKRVPDLDGTQTIFAEVTSGMDIVDSISRARTDENDKPYSDITLYRVNLSGN
ncbi:peptidylprolyl isomerase [Candidatus Wolfebacteria bacterium]|nr:MAG: peptidylprolyl isomerase [Candidatus Wolfebacteria bacterium]